MRPGLIPGVNVDRVDIDAGLAQAEQFGYVSPEHQTVVAYALYRHGHGEEDGARRSARSGGIDLTSWYAILAAAIVAADTPEGGDTVAAPVIVLMEFDKSTDRTRRYKEVVQADETPKIGTLYVPKATLREMGEPEPRQISVTVALA